MKQKHQTNSKLIRFVDRTPLTTFVLFFFAGLFICSFAFYYLSKINQGIKPTFDGGSIDYITSLYFSVVTISSLGYGDYKPINFGRAVAVFEVIYGLII
jgi:hypothetical protein